MNLPTPFPPQIPFYSRFNFVFAHLVCTALLLVLFCTGAARAQSDACDITSFTVGTSVGDILEDEGFGEIYIEVPYGALANGASVAPTIETSEGATVDPASGVGVVPDPVDGFYLYTVTAEDGFTVKEYYVYFYEAFAPAEMLTMDFFIDGQGSAIPGTIGTKSNGVSYVTITLPGNTNLATLEAAYTLSAGATCDVPNYRDPEFIPPEDFAPPDFTNTVVYTVYAEDGIDSTRYVVMVTLDSPVLVGAEGTGEIRFEKKPNISSWATLSVSGTDANITTVAQLDTEMATIAASAIDQPLVNYAGAPTATAHWRYDQFKIGTRPIDNKMTLIKSTLKNASSVPMGGLSISYEIGATNTPAEQINGYRVYWSLTGDAGSWTPVGTHLQTTSGTSTIHFNIEFVSGWAPDSTLYMVWADDNGSGSQGVFTIGQVSFTPLPPAANILSFGLPGYPGVISGNEITLTLPFDTALNALTPTYTLSYGASCDKASGSPQDFRQPVQYTVTSAGPSPVSKVYTVFIQPTDYWTHSAWTNDSTSGIVSGDVYTSTANFGTTTSAVVNGVTFQGVNSTSGTNFTIGGTASAITGRSNNVTSAGGGSATLASSYVFNGIPRTVTLSSLVPGSVYETTFFSVGETNDQLVSDFTSDGKTLRLNPNFYGNNNGIRVIHRFIATTTTRSFSIAPTGSATFRMYALANRQIEFANATIDTTTVLASSLNPSNPTTAPQGVTFTATLKNGNAIATNATGSFAFRRNGVLIGTAPAQNGVANFTATTLLPGNQTINAKYLSDPQYRSSESSLIQTDNTPITLTVNGGTGSGTYLGTDSIIITANPPPNSGVSFAGWVINSGTATIADPESAYTTLTLNGVNATVSATYGTASLGGITPRAWYDASDASSVTVVSGKVSEWRDRSGSNRHVAQSNAARRPSISASTVTFDGVDDLLFRTTSAAFMYAAGSIEVHVVGAMANTRNRTLIAESRHNNDNPWYSIAQCSNGQAGAMGATIRDDGTNQRFANSNILSANTALNRSETKIYSWQDTGTLMSGRVNGGNPTSQAYVRTGTLTLNAFSIGAIGPRANSTTGPGINHMDAGVHEIIITPTLSTADRQKLEGYLAWKWDSIRGNNLLVSALPEGHPYKNAAPATNTTPLAIAKNVAVEYGTATPITLSGYDADGHSLTYATVSGPSHGTLSGTVPNLTYTPNNGFSGNDSFTFKVNDGTVDSSPATVSITVAPGDPYAEWEDFYNLTGGQTGDDDNDGLSNFEEFAFGLNPTSGTSSNPIVAQLNRTSRKFRYTRYADSGLTYTVWASSNLTSWGTQPVEVTEEVISTNQTTNVQTVEVTLPTFPQNTTKYFVRVQAE